MNDQEIRELLDTMLALTPECADREELGRVVGLNAKLKSFTARYDMRCKRRADELAAEGASETGFVLLLSEGNRSGRDATAAVERDRVCNDLPEFETALAAGSVSGEHLDVLARHTKHLTDQERSEVIAAGNELVDAAVMDSAVLFERDLKNVIAGIKARTRANDDIEELERQQSASSVKRWTDEVTGMKMTLLSLDPLRDAAFHGVVSAQLERLRHDPAHAKVPFQQLSVEAVIAAVSANAGAFAVPEIVIHTDARTACTGRHQHSMCETVDGTGVPVATMQRFCCDAAITAVVVEADGTVRNLAEQRTANRHQRRALSAMYSTCAHPHCQVAFSHCRMHHVVWWTNGGPTVLQNLLPVCETHHHLIHEGGWTLTMTADRTVTWSRPDGTVWLAHQSVNRRPGLRDARRSRQRTHAA